MTILPVFRNSYMRMKYPLLLLVAAILAVSFAMPVAARGGEPADDYLAGLDAMSAGQFEQASQILTKATSAQPENTVWQLDRAIALMLSGHDDESQAALALAAKLDPQNDDVPIWQAAQPGLFGRKLPPLVMPGGVELPMTGPMAEIFDPSQPPIRLPTSSVGYSSKLLTSIMGMRSSQVDQQAGARSAIEQVARDFAASQSSGMDAAKALYTAGRYRPALALLEPLQAKNKDDGDICAYEGHCKLGLEDFSGARQAYTQALLLLPTQAGCFIGRARCEIALGAIESAEADLNLARRIDNRDAAALLSEADRLLSDAKARGPAAAGQLIRQEQYTRELCRLELDVRDHPNNVDNILALERFYLRPTALGDVTIDGRSIKAIVPCNSMQATQAGQALAPAVQLAPDRGDVLLEQARVAMAQQRPEMMMAFAKMAMAKNTIDLETAVAWMHYDSGLAKEKSAQAANLANPPAGTWYWKPAGTTYIHVYTGRSPDLAGADQLNQQAKQLRADATLGLEMLQKQTASSTLPHDQVIADLVDAYHDVWFGNLDGAIESAEKAVAIDPVNEHALRLLVLLCGKANSPKAGQYKARFAEVERY